MVQFILSHGALILLSLVVINQILADIPSIKGNTLFTLYRGLIRDQATKSYPELNKILPESKE
jgi:hypothetical protein